MSKEKMVKEKVLTQCPMCLGWFDVRQSRITVGVDWRSKEVGAGDSEYIKHFEECSKKFLKR